jgi:hypothetical protein
MVSSNLSNFIQLQHDKISDGKGYIYFFIDVVGFFIEFI